MRSSSYHVVDKINSNKSLSLLIYKRSKFFPEYFVLILFGLLHASARLVNYIRSSAHSEIKKTSSVLTTFSIFTTIHPLSKSNKKLMNLLYIDKRFELVKDSNNRDSFIMLVSSDR